MNTPIKMSTIRSKTPKKSLSIFIFYAFNSKKLKYLTVKGQLIPFVFIILLVAGVLIGYVFYNMFYGTSYQIQVFRMSMIDVIRNLIESFKNYLRLSLTYSSHQALREHACLGGSIGAGPWICNGPNPVPVEFSKKCLENYTRYYFNVYTGLFNTSLPVRLLHSNFTECVYDLDSGNVLSGDYDEGNFWVNCSGGKIIVSSKNANEYEKIDTNDFITKNRYWYMFRIFYEWAMDDVYSSCICSKIGCACGSSSAEQTCSSTCLDEVEECAQKALDDLQKRFDAVDDYVECEKEKQCCAQGRGPACLPPSDCLPWENSICISDCEHKCQEPPPPGDICPVGSIQSYASGYKNSTITSGSYYSLKFFPLQEPLNCCCDYWYEARLAAGYEFKCVDHKYYVPSEKGPVPLKFVAHAIAFWRDQDACWTRNRCECPEDAISCTECSNICCTECYPC